MIIRLGLSLRVNRGDSINITKHFKIIIANKSFKLYLILGTGYKLENDKGPLSL